MNGTIKVQIRWTRNEDFGFLKKVYESLGLDDIGPSGESQEITLRPEDKIRIGHADVPVSRWIETGMGDQWEFEENWYESSRGLVCNGEWVALDLWFSSLENVDELSSLTQLYSLDLRWCKSLQNVDGLSALTQLSSLVLSGCESLQNVDALRSLNQLSSLDLNCESLQNVNVLSSLTQLSSLDVRDINPALITENLHVFYNLNSLKNISTGSKLNDTLIYLNTTKKNQFLQSNLAKGLIGETPIAELLALFIDKELQQVFALLIDLVQTLGIRCSIEQMNSLIEGADRGKDKAFWTHFVYFLFLASESEDWVVDYINQQISSWSPDAVDGCVEGLIKIIIETSVASPWRDLVLGIIDKHKITINPLWMALIHKTSLPNPIYNESIKNACIYHTDLISASWQNFVRQNFA